MPGFHSIKSAPRTFSGQPGVLPFGTRFVPLHKNPTKELRLATHETKHLPDARIAAHKQLF
jgi:hypothetical protein